MNNRENVERKSNIIIYTTQDGLTKIETTFDEDTVWLSIDQMAELFQRDKSTISRHIKSVFSEGELMRESVVANFATTASDGKTYQVDYYNLDVIISVGYRVKSKRGTQFRIWATNILKEYMRKGFALDDERLKNLGGDDCCDCDDECEEFEVECPLCGAEITVDEETVLSGTIPCPNCGEMLEFEIEEECDCCDED